MNYIEALSIFGYSQSKIIDDSLKSDFRRLSLKYHPDRGGSHDAMVRLNNAYDILKSGGGAGHYSYRQESDIKKPRKPSKPRKQRTTKAHTLLSMLFPKTWEYLGGESRFKYFCGICWKMIKEGRNDD